MLTALGRAIGPDIPIVSPIDQFARIKGEIEPTVGWRKIPIITPQDHFLTSHGPMKVWFDLAREMETRPGVLTASPIPMHPGLDAREGGWKAVVYTDDDELATSLADEPANKVCEQFWVTELVSPVEAVRQAMAAESLVILSDTGDSVYGGAPGDSTCLLSKLVAQQVFSRPWCQW